MELYRLAENCNYGTLSDEMIRDRLVVGITDQTLAGRLQMHADLTLNKARKIVRQQEAVREQQQALKHVEEPSSLAEVHSTGGYRCHGGKTAGGKHLRGYSLKHRYPNKPTK